MLETAKDFTMNVDNVGYSVFLKTMISHTKSLNENDAHIAKEISILSLVVIGWREWFEKVA